MAPPVPPEELDAGDVVLRRERIDDAETLALLVAANLDDLRPWMPWAQPSEGTVERQRERLEEVEQKWEAGSDHTYVVVHRSSGRVMGVCGLHRRVGAGGIEIGYWIDRAHWGRGYATAAAGALTRAALVLDDLDRVEIRVDEANHRSRTIPERLGYQLDRIDEREPTAPGEAGRLMVWVRRPSVT